MTDKGQTFSLSNDGEAASVQASPDKARGDFAGHRPRSRVYGNGKEAFTARRIREVAENRYQAQLLTEAVHRRFSLAFDKTFAYYGRLGYDYGPASTSFALWAPTAYKVTLCLYDSDEAYAVETDSFLMERTYRGVWRTCVRGDLNGKAYDFRIEFMDGSLTTASDPYARATVANGGRAVILSDPAMRPEDPDWQADKPRAVSLEATRTIPGAGRLQDTIMELHIRDFTIAENSGVPEPKRGRFRGVIEPNTHTLDGAPTGLSYLLSQGIHYVQIMPMYDYGSVDELKPHHVFNSQYNWGYDPVNYNVPEGSYSSDPSDPRARVVEMKAMINGLQKAGIRVIMDVVYNHVYDVASHPFERTVPGYFFRTNPDGTASNGTGCGNDVASERLMARKYIVDSVLYWAREYHLDGFRFDLMGNLDIETMNIIRRQLNKIDPTIVVLGEGWNLETSLPAGEHASQRNARKMPGIGFFNDVLRDALKGDTFNQRSLGFVAGRRGEEGVIASEMLGGYYRPHYFTDASQRVQYVEVHDNYTLFDKLKASLPGDTLADLRRRCDLATSMVLLSLGIPEVQVGQCFLRTKGGDGNSYRSPDKVNAVDWERSEEFQSSVDYARGLIAFRRDCPYFRMSDYGQITAHSRIIKQEDGVVALEFFDTRKRYESYALIFNSNLNPRVMPGVESGVWETVVSDRHVWDYSTMPQRDRLPLKNRLIVNDECRVAPLETLVLRSTYRK